MDVKSVDGGGGEFAGASVVGGHGEAGMGITARVDVITTTSVSMVDIEARVGLISAAVVMTRRLVVEVVMLQWLASE